jgi:hypothetical protein
VSITDDVLETTVAFYQCGSKGEQAVVDQLIACGYSPLRAEILLAFVPLGLGRAVIARLPVSSPIHLPEIALIRYSNGEDGSVSLASVPEFVAARQVGEDTFSTGVIPREQLAASCLSVELILLNEMLNNDVDIAGSAISPSILLRLSDAPEFEEWYQLIESK